MIRQGKTSKTTRGNFVPALVTVFLVILFIALLFGARLLQRPASVEISYSERYHELMNRETLNEAEKAELALETCKFRRKRLYFLKGKALANHDQKVLDYQQNCESILPLGKVDQ